MKKLIATLFVIGISVGVAQGQQGKKQEREQLRTKGTIKNMARGLIQIEAEDGGKWVIRIPEKRDAISYTASADPSWLRPGMYVSFRGMFDSKGRPQSEITEISVFQPSEDNRPGIYPESGGISGAKKLFNDEPAAEPDANAKKKSRPKRAPKASKSGKFLVKGRLTSVRDTKVNVAAARTVVQAQLSSKAQVSVEIKGLNLARIGDKIEVDAWYPKGGEAAQRAIANRLTISAAQPLTGKKPSKRNSKRGTKKGATEKKGSEKKKADPFGDDDK